MTHARSTWKAAAAAVALAWAGAAAAQGAPEKFTFALNWFAVGDHAAYWVALDKGYYAQRGLDVTLENSKGQRTKHLNSTFLQIANNAGHVPQILRKHDVNVRI